MDTVLRNSALELSINPHSMRWSLHSRQGDGRLEGVESGLWYSSRLRIARLKCGENEPFTPTTGEFESPHGRCEQVVFSSEEDNRGMCLRLHFALPDQHPFLLLKMQVENRGKQTLSINRLELLNAGFYYVPDSTPLSYGIKGPAVNPAKGGVYLGQRLGEPAFLSNGWQSWNHTGVYGAGQRSRRTRLGPFTVPMRINPGTPHPKRAGLFGSDMFGVVGDRLHRIGLLAGFLSQKQHFGSLEALMDPFSPALRMWANGDGTDLRPGESMDTDWACLHFLHLDEPHPLAPYLDAAARENNVVLPETPEGIPVGWCSWYHYFQKVTAADIRANIAEAARLRDELPLDIIQIDDGFEAQVGDWYAWSPSFPEGIAGLADEIRQVGFTPGLWLAPFIVHPKSRLAREHPEWLLRNRFGRAVNAGYIWGAFTRALDLTVPEALEYAVETVQIAARQWGYRFLKLDFLYAAALAGRRRDPFKTRAQVLRMGLEALREAAGPETRLLGCGCPLGPAVGLVDAMRISSDTDLRWHPTYRGVEIYFRSEPDMPAARNAIHNVLTRAPLHLRWWVNDPDCLLLEEGTRLNKNEVQSLATVIAFSGGSLMLSSRLPGLSAEGLRIARFLLPLIGKTPHVLDWFDALTPCKLQINLTGAAGSWHLLALFNWDNQPRDLKFTTAEFYLDPQREYLSRSIWDGNISLLHRAGGLPNQDSTLHFTNVPPHGVTGLAVRLFNPIEPLYAGSSLHISQGLEVTSWSWKPQERSLSFNLQRPGRDSGKIDLYLPAPPYEAVCNQAKLAWRQLDESCWRFPVQVDRLAEIHIKLEKE
jgi:alpha-galactosidase